MHDFGLFNIVNFEEESNSYFEKHLQVTSPINHLIDCSSKFVKIRVVDLTSVFGPL